MKLPLEGVRVLDLTRVVAGPLCTQFLADLGAEVIKIESPKGGDEMRIIGRAVLMREGQPVPGQTAEFMAVNSNKRSVVIDLASPEGQALVRDLAAASDVFVENFKVGDLARYGLDFPSLAKVNPALIYCSITGYGQEGPLAGQPGFDSVFQAMCGLMSLTGDPDGDPQRVSAPVVDHATGQTAAIAILAALVGIKSGRSGGRHIDIALYDCGLSALTVRAQHYLNTGESPTRSGNRTPRGAPSRLVETADGQIALSAHRDADFARLAALLGRPDLPDDPRFSTNADRYANEPALDAILDPIFAGETSAIWMERLRGATLVAGPVNNVGDALENDHASRRGVVRAACRPDGLEVQRLASPIRYDGESVGGPAAAPDLGQDTDAVLSGVLGLSSEEIQALRNRGVLGVC